VLPVNPTTSKLITSIFTLSSNEITVSESAVYAISGNITLESQAQRFQGTVKVFINGVYDGIERGNCYIRNSGTSYDFYAVSFYTVKELSANDVISFEVVGLTGNTYGNASTLSYNIASSGNEIIIERR